MLEQVRAAIRKGAPGCVELISYQMPAYKAAGGLVIFFAGWKDHFSIYPLTEEVALQFEKDLAPFEESKGTVRFPLSQKPPLKLIEKLAKGRAAETEARFFAKQAAKSIA